MPDEVRLPRTRGDEPLGKPELIFPAEVCPAHAGMSPGVTAARARAKGLPRTRGDEPVEMGGGRGNGQSAPHTRG